MPQVILRSAHSGKLFVQGDSSRQRLVQDFKKASDGFLLGTSSFWQGIDFNGAGVECLVIDKLPVSTTGRSEVAGTTQGISSSRFGFLFRLYFARLRAKIAARIWTVDPKRARSRDLRYWRSSILERELLRVTASQLAPSLDGRGVQQTL